MTTDKVGGSKKGEKHADVIVEWSPHGDQYTPTYNQMLDQKWNFFFSYLLPKLSIAKDFNILIFKHFSSSENQLKLSKKYIS